MALESTTTEVSTEAVPGMSIEIIPSAAPTRVKSLGDLLSNHSDDPVTIIQALLVYFADQYTQLLVMDPTDEEEEHYEKKLRLIMARMSSLKDLSTMVHKLESVQSSFEFKLDIVIEEVVSVLTKAFLTSVMDICKSDEELILQKHKFMGLVEILKAEVSVESLRTACIRRTHETNMNRKARSSSGETV